MSVCNESLRRQYRWTCFLDFWAQAPTECILTRLFAQHPHVHTPVGKYFTLSSEADTDCEMMRFGPSNTPWDIQQRYDPKVVPDGKVLWRLPGNDESCWDVCHRLAFDDLVSIAILGTAQGYIWVLDYAQGFTLTLRADNQSYSASSEHVCRLSRPNRLLRDNGTVIAPSYSPKPLQYLDGCLSLPDDLYVIGTDRSDWIIQIGAHIHQPWYFLN